MGINTSLSKDVLKIRLSLSIVISSTKKMRSEVNLPSVSSTSEMQWRRRQFNLSFTTVSTKENR
jgi:hypothetical protein